VLRLIVRALRAMLVASLDRLRHGPAVPGWSWRLEWLVAAYREALCDSMRLPPDRMRALVQPPPSRVARGVSLERVALSGVPALRVDPAGSASERCLLYIHGGGFVIGSADGYLDLTAALALASGARVWSLDYRLAPESPFPAALDDVFTAYRALLDQGVDPTRLAVAGDSAGGNLTLALLVRLRDCGVALPSAAVLISPAADLRLPGKSWEARRRTDCLSKEICAYWIAHYLQGRDPRDPAASPVLADLHGLPPLLVQVGTAECLHDDVLDLVEKLRSASVNVALSEHAGMPHVWHLFRVFVPQADEAIQEIGRFLREHAGCRSGQVC
jgi:epsilon-lactone hydrolase